MSYDIYLKEPASGEMIQFDTPHIMTGGTFAAIYDERTGQFHKTPITDARLNITYNYSSYYYSAAENDERFLVTDENGEQINGSIRGIYGKFGYESIAMLQDLIDRITSEFKSDGDWITTKREVTRYYDDNGTEIDIFESINMHSNLHKKIVTEEIYEGVNDDYWAETAGNAIKPLFQLLAFAHLRPDGIWDGD